MIGDLCHSSSDFRIKRPAETKQARTIVDQTIFANNVYGEKEILWKFSLPYHNLLWIIYWGFWVSKKLGLPCFVKNRKLLTGGSYWSKTNAPELHFARSFQGYPTWPYFARPNMYPNMHIWHIWPYLAYLGAYLGAPNMVKWGIPEKILQNAVQTRWS